MTWLGWRENSERDKEPVRALLGKVRLTRHCQNYAHTIKLDIESLLDFST